MDAEEALALFFQAEDDSDDLLEELSSDESEVDDSSSDSDGNGDSEAHSSGGTSGDEDDDDLAYNNVYPRGRGRAGGIRGCGRGAARGNGRGRGRGVGGARGGHGRGAGAGQARGRGRGRGRGGGGGGGGGGDGVPGGDPPANGGGNEANQGDLRSWDDTDDEGAGAAPHFAPDSPPGYSLPPNFHPTEEADFFKLFFTPMIVAALAAFTNTYAWMHVADCPSYGDRFGAWQEATGEEMYKLFALLIYTGLVKLPSERGYWKTTSLYHGTWARRMIPKRDRFLALMQFLHVTDPTGEQENDRLRKVRFIYDHMKTVCRSLYKPGQFLSVDERMIKSKARFLFKQYLPKKPTKWGTKVFALCDVKTAYLCDFNIYTGANDGEADMNLTSGTLTSGWGIPAGWHPESSLFDKQHMGFLSCHEEDDKRVVVPGLGG